MPFKSKAQRRACYAKNDPNWDCEEWEEETPDNKRLPEKKKKKNGKKGKIAASWVSQLGRGLGRGAAAVVGVPQQKSAPPPPKPSPAPPPVNNGATGQERVSSTYRPNPANPVKPLFNRANLSGPSTQRPTPGHSAWAAAVKQVDPNVSIHSKDPFSDRTLGGKMRMNAYARPAPSGMEIAIGEDAPNFVRYHETAHAMDPDLRSIVNWYQNNGADETGLYKALYQKAREKGLASPVSLTNQSTQDVEIPAMSVELAQQMQAGDETPQSLAERAPASQGEWIYNKMRKHLPFTGDVNKDTQLIRQFMQQLRNQGHPLGSTYQTWLETNAPGSSNTIRPLLNELNKTGQEETIMTDNLGKLAVHKQSAYYVRPREEEEEKPSLLGSTLGGAALGGLGGLGIGGGYGAYEGASLYPQIKAVTSAPYNRAIADRAPQSIIDQRKSAIPTKSESMWTGAKSYMPRAAMLGAGVGGAAGLLRYLLSR